MPIERRLEAGKAPLRLGIEKMRGRPSHDPPFFCARDREIIVDDRKPSQSLM
jgi:hypothetical protein